MRPRSRIQAATRQQSGRARAHGFTLIEVMVALTIFAVAGVAMMSSMTQSVETQFRLEEKILAQWVLENEYNELLVSGQPPTPGETRQDTTLGGIEWSVLRRVVPTSEITILRLEFEAQKEGLQREERRNVASLTSFIGTM